MKNIKLIVLTVVSFFVTNSFAQIGSYSTRTISNDGKTSKWIFNVVTGSDQNIANGTEDNGIIFVNGSGSNKAKKDAYVSFNKSETYIEVPSGSAGSITMEVYSSSDSRWFQLYINGTAGPSTQRLWSKAGDGSDGKKGPQTFTFAATDITTKDAKTYLYLKTNGTEMKVSAFTITLTSGSYSGSTPPEKSHDATLSSIVYGSEKTPIANFSSSQTSYEVELPATYVGSAPSIQGTTTDTNANITDVTQATSIPGTASITVTAEDGTTTLTYYVSFTKESADPKVESATWANIKGTAAIDQVNKTITGQVTNGSSLTLEPQFSGKNIASYTPNGAQNFANGAISYTFTSSTNETTTYQVTITEAPAVSSDATLKSLTYGGASVPNFSPTTYVYNIQLANGIKTPPAIDAETSHPKATKEITPAQSVPGSGKVVVTAEDGETKLTYTINYTVEVPVSGLTIHGPEIYEAKTIAGGYGGTLSVFDGHEYEVYYSTYDNDSHLQVAVTPGQKLAGITTTTTNNYSCKANDGWFEMTTSTSKSDFKDRSGSDLDEFKKGEWAVHKLLKNGYYMLHIQGYDQFSFYGKENSGSGKYFEVYVDDIVQPMTKSTSATIRRFDITTGEHVIKVVGVGDSNEEFYGFSLRVAQEPRTKYFRGDDSSQVVYQTQEIKPIVYTTKYNNIPGAETKLEWLGAEANGITLAKVEGALSDTLTLSGYANCPIGTYNYAVVAYYNGVETNRVTGKFFVKSSIKAATDINVTVYNNEQMDQIKFKYYALDASTVQLTWGANGQPTGVNGSGADGIYIIGGTPTISGTLPQAFPYSITVVGADTTIKGTITIKELKHTDKDVLYLYKNTDANNAPICDYLRTQGWNPIERKAQTSLRSADQYALYKWILISEDVDANNPEVFQLMRGAPLPVLNMKAFSYSHTIDSLKTDSDEGYTDPWGEADNGSLSENGKSITVLRDDHPIFSKLNKKKGETIQVLDSIDRRGLMPIKVTKTGSLCLATAWTRDREDYFGDGELQTFLHEVPAETSGNAKYICFPLAISSSPYLTTEGKNLLKAVVDYITSPTASVQKPILGINQFKVGDIEGDIDDGTSTITITIDSVAHPELANLSEVTPEITLVDSYTHIIPPKESLYIAQFIPIRYVVSDYIKQRTYEVTVNYRRAQGIEDVYTAGEWVNIFDIYGRKVTTTNEDIYSMPLPRGMYIVVTANGQTLKIMR